MDNPFIRDRLVVLLLQNSESLTKEYSSFLVIQIRQ